MDAFTIMFNEIVNQIICPVIIEHNRSVFKLRALIDTGAMHSTIPAWVSKTLNLQEVGIIGTKFAKGHDILPIVSANLIFSNDVYFKNTDFIVIDDEDHTYDVIIGMDILSQGDVAISNYAGRTTFTFRKPSQGETVYSDNLVTDGSIKSIMDKIEDELLST